MREFAGSQRNLILAPTLISGWVVGLGINRLRSLLSIARKPEVAGIRKGYFWRKADVSPKLGDVSSSG
jgi:hypothetical protein